MQTFDRIWRIAHFHTKKYANKCRTVQCTLNSKTNENHNENEIKWKNKIAPNMESSACVEIWLWLLLPCRYRSRYFQKNNLKTSRQKNEVRNKCTCVLHMFSACLVTAKNNDAMHYIRTVLHVIKLSIALASKNKFSFI